MKEEKHSGKWLLMIILIEANAAIFLSLVLRIYNEYSTAGTIQIFGWLGAGVLASASAMPEKKNDPWKNRFLFSGTTIMTFYAALNYFLGGGHILFVLLQGLIQFASIMMLKNAHEKFVKIAIIIVGTGILVWSVFLFEGFMIIFFVLGILTFSIAYIIKDNAFYRVVLFIIAGVLVAIFSFVVKEYPFAIANGLIALFSLHNMKLEYHKRDGDPI